MTTTENHDVAFDLAHAFDATEALHTTTSPVATAGVIAAALERVLVPDCISIYLYDVNDDVMRRVAGRPDERAPPRRRARSRAVGTHPVRRLSDGPDVRA